MSNISQSTLANALGVSLQQMQKYENGINRVGASRLHQIAKVLQIPIASFFDAPAKVVLRTERAPSPFADVEAFAATREG